MHLSLCCLSQDPSEAIFFFIPTRCSAYRPWVEDLGLGNAMATNITAQMLQEIIWGYPYWNASLGADHFYICAHDMGTKVASRSDPNLFKNAIALVNTADSAAPFFVPHKDISIPPHPGRGFIAWHEIGLGGANIPNQERKTLLFFAGNATRSVTETGKHFCHISALLEGTFSFFFLRLFQRCSKTSATQAL